MPMTPEQCSAALMRLREVWPAPGECPCCTQNEWVMSGIVEVRDYFCAPTDPTVKAVPLLVVSCRKCGRTLMFNAVVLGLVRLGTGEFVFPEEKEVKP